MGDVDDDTVFVDVGVAVVVIGMVDVIHVAIVDVGVAICCCDV